MGHLRQAYLGASPHQTLCITPYSHRRPFVPTGECFLRRLPDELLCRILEYLAPRLYMFDFDYGPCLPIPLVCRRWERLFSSILYRNINLGSSCANTNRRRIKEFDATLRQRPDLGDAVRRVEVSFHPTSDATCEMLAYILSCCKGLRELLLEITWTQSAWIVLNAAKRASLETLELRRGPSLQMILKHFSLPTLKELSLAYYGLGNGEKPGAQKYPSSDTAHEDLKLLISSAPPCNVTTMVLERPSAPAHVTRSFLQWPARLTSLTMRCIINSACDADYTVDNVQGILDDHHHTLQNIGLGILAHGIRSLPDFSSFMSLEWLQIHGYNLFGASSCSAASRLKAPQLCSLGISFNTEDQHQTSPQEFGPDKIGWLEGFFDHMTPGANKLKTVFVEFEPEARLSDAERTNNDTWSWSYIDQAVGIFAAHNVAMTYTQPHIPRKEWDQAVENRKQKAAMRAFVA